MAPPNDHPKAGKVSVTSLWLISGKPIPVGAADRLGPLAAPAIASYPVGIASVFGLKQPDLFVIGKAGMAPDAYIRFHRRLMGFHNLLDPAFEKRRSFFCETSAPMPIRYLPFRN